MVQSSWIKWAKEPLSFLVAFNVGSTGKGTHAIDFTDKERSGTLSWNGVRSSLLDSSKCSASGPSALQPRVEQY